MLSRNFGYVELHRKIKIWKCDRNIDKTSYLKNIFGRVPTQLPERVHFSWPYAWSLWLSVSWSLSWSHPRVNTSWRASWNVRQFMSIRPFFSLASGWRSTETRHRYLAIMSELRHSRVKGEIKRTCSFPWDGSSSRRAKRRGSLLLEFGHPWVCGPDDPMSTVLKRRQLRQCSPNTSHSMPYL